MKFEYITKVPYMLLKPKRHSLRCHGFMVHALLLRMRTNVVYFRVLQRLCRREWNWLCVSQHPWQRTCDHGVWHLTSTAHSGSFCLQRNTDLSTYQTEAPGWQPSSDWWMVPLCKAWCLQWQRQCLQYTKSKSLKVMVLVKNWCITRHLLHKTFTGEKLQLF